MLYSISTDFNNPEGETIGGCGVCFLQTMEMIYQLASSYLALPTRSHLFEYQTNRNPFISFRSRFPELSRNYRHFAYVQWLPLIVGEDVFDRTLRVTRGTLDMTLG